MTRRYTAEQIQRLFEKMAGAGLWIPQRDEQLPPAGPTITVYLKHSELFPGIGNVQEQYWQLLQQVPVVNAIGVLACISNILALTARDRACHRELHERFLDPNIAEQVAQYAPGGTAFPVVFHRLGNMALMRNLVLYGANTNSTTDAPLTLIGTLALCANDFVEPHSAITGTPTNLELAAQFIGTWDLHNVRDVAYALTRMHTILTELLPGNDPLVSKLRTRIGVDSLVIDTLTLPEFVGIVFGLFAYGNKIATEGMNRVLFEPTVILREFPYAQQLLNRFLEGRALSTDQLAERLRRGMPRTREQFLKDLGNRNVLTTGLTVFRQHPLLRLKDGRVVILDLQFVTDLLTSGVYWLLFDALPDQIRDSFRELWGRAFELYVTNLLRVFYPAGAQLLTTDILYPFGQIDALLDFGSDVFVFEIKSSLLTEAAKRSGDPALLAHDVERKFVRNEHGHPKAVVQLARAAQSIAKGELRTTIAPARIYPVLVTDEPACECFGFNAYLNELFQQELSDTPEVRPITVMSIDECEELLPYVANNAFSWAELCETRFDKGEVRAGSVHQAIYDFRHRRGMEVQRNKYLLEQFEAIYENILRTYARTHADKEKTA